MCIRDRAIPAGSSIEIEFIYPIPNPIPVGSYFIGFGLDAYDMVTEINENNLFYHPDLLIINNTITSTLKLPYPIIFVHGLNSNSETWNPLTDEQDRFYGWNFGGRMNFCLNDDSNDGTSLFVDDYQDFTLTSNNLGVGDYYYVNFDVSPTGVLFNNSVNSNQAAIFKQGRAIKDAIGHVLQITGSDKVILVGHSMGGLALSLIHI